MEDEKYSRDDSDVSEAEDDDSNSGVNNAAPPIMSLFASFYGIEDPTKNAEVNGGRGTIDDANFAAEEYVRVSLSNYEDYFLILDPCSQELLVKESLEGLTMKDAEMVHEIRVKPFFVPSFMYVVPCYSSTDRPWTGRCRSWFMIITINSSLRQRQSKR